MKATGVGLSDLAYFDNLLHHEPSTREKKHDFLLRVFDAAVLLEVSAVCGFVGPRAAHRKRHQFKPIARAARALGGDETGKERP